MIDIDFETRSKIDIMESGAWRYASDPSTSVLCMAYKIGDSPTRLWAPPMPLPDWCKDIAFIKDEGIRAHNAAFEQSIWHFIMVREFGCPEISPAYWYDTMAQAASMSLPLSLGGCAEALSLKTKKDEDGRRVMLQLSAPRRASKYNTKTWYEKEDYPEKFAELYKYCVNDVDVQREIADKLPPLTKEERSVWILDQIINQRGVPIDLALARKCAALTEEYSQLRNAEVKKLTGGISVSQTAKLRDWLVFNGVNIPNLTKMVLENLDISSLPKKVASVISARQVLSLTSTKKIDAMLAASDSNGRIQYTAVYHGASTGRWAGRLIQPQNFTRGILDKEKHGVDSDDAIADLLTMDLNTLLSKYNNCKGLDVMQVISSCLRGFIAPPKGRTLMAADFSNIEGRILAWIAKEDWKIEAFKEYDAGRGPDLYKLIYSRTFGIPLDAITKAMRQIGKVMELALGYMGGVGAFQNMAKGYGVTLRPMFPTIWESAEEGEKKSALSLLLMDQRRNADRVGTMFDHEKFKDYEDYRENYLAGDIVKQKWRSANPNICKFWSEVEECAIKAVLYPGTSASSEFLKGRISYEYDRASDFLFCVLPSGRKLSYYAPRVSEYKRTNRSGEKVTAYKLTYMGTNSVTKKWERHTTYGGHLTENIVQAAARDCLVNGMFNAENNGYTIIMTVHDEIVCEVDEGFGSIEEFCKLITRVPEWAEGLPLSAEGWVGTRYRK